jgi:hypothetical protein
VASTFWKWLEDDVGIQHACSATCFAVERDAQNFFYPDISSWPEFRARHQLS